ncbi:MAG: D-alanyl-D-alanine carboxypeptidase [Treponema sp.]|nr:D-alanyl-D-alanine carboxypeptidase [Treponema sp.]
MNAKKNDTKKLSPTIRAKIIISSLTAILILFIGLIAIRSVKLKNAVPSELTHLQQVELETVINEKYPERNKIIHELPFKASKAELDVYAESVILIDTATGDILYEKNADEIIPPASLTKLFAMYVVEQEIENGNLSYNSIIPIPEEAYACNMPPHSSLMFLGEGHKVTLEELILGLSIASGNDAAYALAYTISGSMEAFIERMNAAALSLGLKNTHFTEASGYSEENCTTAREMAAFCRIYLNKYPQSLQKFHSVRSFTYPKPQNMADGDVYKAQDWSNGLPSHITMGITQKNTNPLLDILPGCDGLKTGYIQESGYNLALTAVNNQTRFLSITMKGPGNNTQQGQEGRIHDGKELMNFAFGSFADYNDTQAIKDYKIYVPGSKEISINLTPAYKETAVCVPYLTGNSMAENLSNVRITVELPSKLKGKINTGTQYGVITVSLEDYILEQIPLVADRTVKSRNFIFSFIDSIILKFMKK